MTTVGVTHDEDAATTGQLPRLISPEAAVRIGVIGVLFVVLFWDILYRAFAVTFRDGKLEGIGYAFDGDWSHAFAVPLIGIYFIYQNRDRLKAMTARTSWFGLVMILAGIAGYCLGIYPIQNDMAKGYSMILALGGVVLLLTGWQMASILWFPVAYLVFAIKISEKLWGALAFKLQWIAAQCATEVINVLGMPLGIEADVMGHHITLWHNNTEIQPSLTVAEACSGMRSLMMFIALGVAVAFLARRPWWIRLIMVGSTIPVAIIANIMRVTALGLIRPYNEELIHGDAHVLIGLVMLIVVALVMFMGLGWILDKLSAPAEQAEGGQA